MTGHRRRLAAAVLSGALVAGLLALPATSAQATSTPRPAGAGDLPAVTSPKPSVEPAQPIVSSVPVSAGKVRALSSAEAAEGKRKTRSLPRPPVPMRPSDGAATQRDLASGAVRPLDGTRLVPEATASPCRRPVGRVRTAGPGDIWLVGTARCSGGVWRMTVTGGSGHIGGMPLASSQFSGWVQWDDSGPASSVRVGLPLHPRVVPAWAQSARATLRRANGPWTGTVLVAQGSAATGSLTMRGALLPGNRYRLQASGRAPFAGGAIALTGWFDGPALPGAKATWQIGGRGTDARISGARVGAPSIWMTQAWPGITGRATVQVDAPMSVSFPATLDIRGPRSWSLAVAGSASPGTWSPSSLRAAAVTTSRLTGTITSSSRGVTWGLSAPFALTEGRMSVQGALDVFGPATWRLRPTSATGRILDVAADLPFTGSGSAVIDRGAVRGAIQLQLAGELLARMPEGWTTRTTYALTPVAGARIAFRHSVTSSLSNGGSRVNLAGFVSPTGGPFELQAGGSLLIDGTPVPVGGQYRSVGWLVGDTPLAAPELTVQALLDGVAGGRAPLSGGGFLSGGTFGFEGAPSPAPALSATTTTPTTPAPTYTVSTIAGKVEVQPTSVNSFSITSSYHYTNSTNWSLTVSPDSTVKSWTPQSGITFSEANFSGTVTNVNGTQTWSVTTTPVAWTDMTNGASMNARPWTLSNTCTLANATACPIIDYQGVYLATSGGTITFVDNTAPGTGVGGSMLADGSWALFEGAQSSVTANYFPMSNVTLHVFHGTQSVDFDPGVILPDLSGGKMGFESCGQFQVEMPAITTVSTNGCVAWSSAGTVVGQAWALGDFTTEPSNNVNIKKGSVTGYAWTNILRTQPIYVTLNQTQVQLVTWMNTVVSDIVVPGGTLHDIGTGKNTDGTFVAVGSFTWTDWTAYAIIPVGLKNGTVSLDAVTIYIHLSAEAQTVAFGVKGSAKVAGKKFQLTGLLRADKPGGTVAVSLDVKGTRNSQPAGGFDVPNLIPSGDFEPGPGSVISDTFDGNRPTGPITDPSFESGTAKSSLVENSGFEDHLADNEVVDGGFESTSGRNLLHNGDGESTELLANGDFDEYVDTARTPMGLAQGWTTDSGFSTSLIANDPGPPDGSGSTSNNSVMLIHNTSSGVATGNKGMRQAVATNYTAGATYRLSAWVRSDTSGGGTAQASIIGTAANGCAAKTTSQTWSVEAGAWKQITLDYSNTCSQPITVVLTPYSGSWTMGVDTITMEVLSSTAPVTLPRAIVPAVHGRWNSEREYGWYSAGSTQSSSQGGVLQSDGCDDYAYLGAAGSISGDFDASIDVYFPSGDNKRDIFQFAFAMSGTDKSATGWAYRVQSSGTDSGFFKYPGGRIGGDGTNPLARDTWYTVRLVVTGTLATAWVHRVSDGAQMSRVTYDLGSSYTRSGYLGQAYDAACSAQGHLLDNFSVQSNTTGFADVVYDPTATRPHTDGTANNAYIRLANGSSNSWTAQYDVPLDSVSGTYTYSAWVKSSTGSSFNADLILDTQDGSSGDYEKSAQTITVTPSWQQVSVTLPIQKGGHVGLRAGFTNVGTTTSAIMLDDQSLVNLVWGTPSSTPNSVTIATSPQAHSGSEALAIVDHSNGSQVTYAIAPPVPNATYHLSMWVASTTPYTARVTLGDEAAGDFTTEGLGEDGKPVWQEVTVEYTPPSGSENVFIDIQTLTGNNGKLLLVDDVSVTASHVYGTNSGKAGDIPAPTGWSASSAGAPYVNSDATAAHSGSGFLRVPAFGSYTSSKVYGQYTYTGTLQPGTTYQLGLAVRTPDSGTGGQVTVSISGNSSCSSVNHPTRSVNLSTSWQSVSVDCTVVSSSMGSLTVKVQSSTWSTRLDIDDVSLKTEGPNLQDDWSFVPTVAGNSVSAAVITDPGHTHSGDNYFQLRGNGSAAKAYVDSSFSASTYSTWSLAGWVRSYDGSSATGRLTLIGYDGSGNQVSTRSTDVTVSGSAWRRGYVSVTFPSSVTRVRTQLETTVAGTLVEFDDIDSRPVQSFSERSASGMTASMTQQDDASQAASGNGYLSLTVSGTPTGSDRAGAAISTTQTVNAGTTNLVTAYVRVPSGAASIGARVGITYGAGTSTAETVYQTFTATGSWQKVTASLTAAANHGSSTVQVFVAAESAGALDIDEVLLTPQVLSTDPGWVSYTDGGGSVSWQQLEDPTNAHGGSYGVVKMTRSGSSGRGGIRHTVSTAPAQSQSYDLNAWVRSPSGAPTSLTMELCFDGGTSECKSLNYTTPSDGSWGLMSLALSAANTGHTGMHVSILQTSTTGTTYVDDVALQQLTWTGSSTGDSHGIRQIVNDPDSAQSGSGYLQLTNNGTGTASATVDTSRTFQANTYQYVSVWVRSHTSDPVSADLYVGPPNGPYQKQSLTVTPDWTLATMTYQVQANTPDLWTRITVTTPHGSLDIDTMAISDSNAPPDGVNTPLDHPDWGYQYLWNDAFGIKGVHLWDITGQVEFDADGTPGLGMGATAYLDPSQFPDLMTGTGWIKGDTTVNVAALDPCFSLRFDGTASGSALSIDNGVMKTSLFYLNWAPRGCTVGTRAIPRGVSIGFTSELGDADVTMSLLMGTANDGSRIFHGEAGITNMVLGGTKYNTVHLWVDKSSAETQTFFEANMETEIGNFYGRLYLDTTPGGYLSLVGTVNLTDWHLVGGGFDVQEFSFYVNEQIPFAPAIPCGTIIADTSGRMTLANKAGLEFSGKFASECGVISTLRFQTQYWHGGVERDLVLDYHADTGILSGGVSFEFNRSFSWKFFGHRYHRHPKFYIALAFAIDKFNPSQAAEATLTGRVDVAGGDGSVDCQLSSSGDDYCRLKVDINGGIGGGHHYEADW